MTPERWQIVKDVFQAAVHCDEGQRAAYLDRACAGDPSLRADVEAMLASDERAGSFLEQPVIDLEPNRTAEEPPTSRVGSTIGHYQVLSQLGAGGMADVYLAEDSRLGRKVALKVLASALVTNAASQARFVREARLASALDHPNICTIYEVGEADGAAFISMQYVDGHTLKDVVGGRPLSVDRLLSYAVQVADALAAAHAAGIVHRDIKSSNIMVTPSGQAKVVDFGISKALEPGSETGGSSLTRSGAFVGTPSSMAPEQARGERADSRSDIFSFGTVLYEMATGRVPFSRRSAAESMNAVINESHTPVREVNPQIPPPLARIIDHALAKDAAHRYQSVENLRRELSEVVQAPGVASSESRVSAIIPRASVLAALVRRGRSLHIGRWRTMAAAAAAILLVAAVSGGLTGVTGGTGTIDSVAVLPFAHENMPADIEYLADGIGESVTGRLSQLPQLRVMARSTMSTYRGRNSDPRAVGRELGVEAVLTGQVLQNQNIIVARLELVAVKDGSRLWGGEYNRPLSELFALPGDLAQAVSRELRVRLTGQQEQRLATEYTRSAEAYQHYVKGRYFSGKRTADSVTRSIDYFQSAIHADPTFALAYSGLADAYLILRAYGMGALEQTMLQAEAAAEQALKLDDLIAEAHTSLGHMRTHRFDWGGADAAFKRAIELNPNYATAHHWQAMYLASVGRLEEAMVAIRRAQALDPLSLIVNTEVGRLLYFSRQHDAAIAQYTRVLEMDPDFVLAHLHLGTALVAKGLYTDAIAEFQKAAPAGGPMPAAGVIRAYALAGRRQEATAESRRFREQVKAGFTPPYAMAMVSLSLGDQEEAMAWLEKGVSDGGPWFLKVNPLWDVLRSNPRFQALVRRTGLTP